MYSVRCNASYSFKPFKRPDACFSLSDLYSMKFAFQWIFKIAIRVVCYLFSRPLIMFTHSLWPHHCVILMFLICEALHVSHSLILFQTPTEPVAKPTTSRTTISLNSLSSEVWSSSIGVFTWVPPVHVKTGFRFILVAPFPMAPSLGWCWTFCSIIYCISSALPFTVSEIRLAFVSPILLCLQLDCCGALLECCWQSY